MKLEPDGAEALWANGELEEAQGHGDRAVADYKRAIAVKPGLKQASARPAAPWRRRSATRRTARYPASASTNGRSCSTGQQFFAVSDQYKKLRIPLEMAGEGKPQLLEWEVKPPPLHRHRDVALHRRRDARTAGPEEVEQVAILDLDANSVDRDRAASRGHEDRRLDLAGRPRRGGERRRCDDEFILRAARPVAANNQRYAPTDGAWSPFGQLDSSQYDRGERRRRPRTIFQLAVRQLSLLCR